MTQVRTAIYPPSCTDGVPIYAVDTFAAQATRYPGYRPYKAQSALQLGEYGDYLDHALDTDAFHNSEGIDNGQ